MIAWHISDLVINLRRKPGCATGYVYAVVPASALSKFGYRMAVMQSAMAAKVLPLRPPARSSQKYAVVSEPASTDVQVAFPFAKHIVDHNVW